MTVDGRPLFRPEAVEHHAKGRTETRPLDLGSGRTAWWFRGLCVAVLACVLGGFVLHADLSAEGTGVVRDDGTTARLTMPGGALGRMRPGQPVRIEVDGPDAHGTVTRVGTPEAGPGGFVVPVLVTLDEPVPAQSHGKAVVRLGRPTLVALLLGRKHG